MNKRERTLASARIAGYHNDSAEFTSLMIYGRVARPALNEAWEEGVRLKAAGMKCDCYQCKKAA